MHHTLAAGDDEAGLIATHGDETRFDQGPVRLDEQAGNEARVLRLVDAGELTLYQDRLSEMDPVEDHHFRPVFLLLHTQLDHHAGLLGLAAARQGRGGP